MMKTVIATACLFAATSVFADAKPDASLEFKTTTNVQCNAGASGGCATQNVTFQCDSTPTGQCYFVVMVTNCSAQGTSGKDDEACVIRKFDQFALKTGESKIAVDVPRNFNHCTDVSPIADLQACMAKPVRH